MLCLGYEPPLDPSAARGETGFMYENPTLVSYAVRGPIPVRWEKCAAPYCSYEGSRVTPDTWGQKNVPWNCVTPIAI